MEGILDFKQLQTEHKEWQKYNFPNTEAFEALLKVGEECGELISAFIHQYQKLGDKDELRLKEINAVGDIVISLAGFCNLRGIDFQEAVENTWWGEVKLRDWVKYPKNGVSE